MFVRSPSVRHLGPHVSKSIALRGAGVCVCVCVCVFRLVRPRAFAGLYRQGPGTVNMQAHIYVFEH